MAMQSELGQEKTFVHSVLPWLAAATALLLYLLTLNHWVSFNSLTFVARATGQLWTPELSGPYPPLFYLVTYPFRWLPEKWIPLALNLFSAVCAALTLGLLARSVALLPHDRTHEQRQREHGAFALLSLRTAWIPPVLAAAVCGLQLSFWERATVVSDEIFEVLLFAYVVRCLLEYRIDQRDSWILRAALIYGAAMTGNWLMTGLFPAFIVFLVWIRGTSFFNLHFLAALLLCCLAGLMLWLLLPLLYVFSGKAEISFWRALKFVLLAQKDTLQLYFLRMPRYILLLLATTSLLPVLLISIRWASHFGDPSKVGIAVTTGILHVAHSALLMACIWVAFDPVFSLCHKGVVILELYYLGALSVGYFIGYFLLVFRPVFNRIGRTPGWRFALNRVSHGVIWGLLFLVPLGLIDKNLPQIRITNGPAMKQYASLLTQNLPARGVILCDSQARGDVPLGLWLANAWLARSGKAKDYMFADTMTMKVPAYQGFQQKRYAKNWPAVADPKSTKGIPDVVLMKLVIKLSEQNPVYYLNLTFGYYMEVFYQQPHGLALELRRYPTNSITQPPLTAAEITENEKFWKTNQAILERLLPWIQQRSLPDRSGGFRAWWMKIMKIPFEPNATALRLGQLYSQSLNFWGIQLQKAGRLREAGHCFELALALNPANVAAQANAECNKDLRAHRQLRAPTMQLFEEELAKYRDWQQVLRDNGLFDDPTHCLIQALTFTKGNLYLEAAQQFERLHELDPDFLPALIWLARFYASRLPEKSLALLSQIRAEPDALEEFGMRKQDISMTEAMALFASKKAPQAEQVLKKIMDENPKDQALLSVVVQISTMFRRFSNALSAVERELQIVPTNCAALVVEGYLQMQNGNFAEAIPPLTRALSLETNNQTARFNRAVAYLRNNQLDQAKQDYEILERVFPSSFRIYYGLGEIAWQKKDTNTAIRYYTLYLTNSIADSEEAKLIGERLQSLKARSP